jgi:ferric-dicitrate binding protein FerR (iron transport regulator)
MYSLLARHFSGLATEEEKATINKWINSDEQNEADYRLLQQLWNQSAEPETISFDTEKALQAVTIKLDDEENTRKPGRVFTLKRMVAVAASLIIMFFAGWLAFNRPLTRTVLAETDAQEVQLKDGSKVYLRKGAVLKFPDRFVKNNREVSLTGEAFFQVARNPDKPFIITAAKTEVTVLGTSFSVIAGIDTVALIVKTGRVNFNPLHNTGSKVIVSAGERAICTNNNITKEANTDPNFNAWQSKQLVFKNTPLKQVAATLSNYYKVTIELNKKDMAQIALAGITVTFSNQPLSSVLQELSLITSYRIKKLNDTSYEISAQ